ncbi:hypothetical protein FKM82_009434 [Ascaphus truei]
MSAAMEFVVCPFNSDHKVRGTDLRMHIMTCQDKCVQESRVPAQQPAHQKQPAQQQQSELFPKKKVKWRALQTQEKREQTFTDVCDPQDPERLLQCPYDTNHQIRACRFPYHLIKCRKSHPDVARLLTTCPFNARHMMPRAELNHHISSCDDKRCIEQDIVEESRTCRRDVSPSMWQSPPCEEDWDKDLQHGAMIPFMWGTPTYPSASSGTIPGTIPIMNQGTCLGSNLRVPKSLPYILPWKLDTKRE